MSDFNFHVVHVPCDKVLNKGKKKKNGYDASNEVRKRWLHPACHVLCVSTLGCTTAIE